MNSNSITMNPITTVLHSHKPSPSSCCFIPSLHPHSFPCPSSFPFLSRRQTPKLNLTVSASTADVDMVRGRDGVWCARPQKVVVLWDLDNKPPRGPPYDAACSLRRAASLFGHVVDVSAYANRHAFDHLPQWVLDQRRDRRRLEVLERKGIAVPSEPYVCGLCGRKCRTNLDLKRHFKQLHERERQKKLARMRSLKGRKRQKYKERFVSGNHRYEETARELLTPKTGYGLASELRRAGVFVRTVADKPQAADWALKKQMQHSMARGLDWMVLVSDDSDFTEMVRRAREAELRTVVIGDGRNSLGRHADLWVPWVSVENGHVDEEILIAGRNVVDDIEDEREELHSYGSFEGDYEDEDDEAGGDLVDVIDEIVIQNSGFGGVKVSAFSEEEVQGGEDFGHDAFGILESSFAGMELVWDSDEEEDGYV